MAKLKDGRLRRLFGKDLKFFDLDLATIAWLPGKENSRYLGKILAEYVKVVGKSPSDALCDLLCEEGLAVLLVFHRGDDELVHPFLAHDCYMMGTDGLYFPDGVVHPRMYGSSGRLLGPCVRDHKLFSLEEAVLHVGVTSQPWCVTEITSKKGAIHFSWLLQKWGKSRLSTFSLPK